MPRYEDVSSVPAFPDVGLTRKKSLSEQIRDMVRNERMAQALAEGDPETFEEADDFDVEDEMFPESGYEHEEIFEPEEVPDDPGLDRRVASALARLISGGTDEAPEGQDTGVNEGEADEK